MTHLLLMCVGVGRARGRDDACRRFDEHSRTGSLWPASGLGAQLLPVRCALGLRGETVTEAVERAEQRVDLEERVLAQLFRLERELKVDRVGAVGDLQHELRIAIATTPGRVLDEDTHEGVAVQTRVVQPRVLVYASR